MSSENCVRIVMAENLRFPWVGSSATGKPGAKARSKDVADGQQVEIPVLRYERNVGTHVESMSRERKDRCKRDSSHAGKSVWQYEGVTRTEKK